MKPRASPEKSSTSTPSNTTPRPRQRFQAASSLGASSLHGPHQEAQKLSTTALPRSDARLRRPRRSSRCRTKFGAAGCLPERISAATFLSWCVTFQTSSASRPATSATAAAWATSFSRAVISGRHDEDRRPDVDVHEQPLGVVDVHADAAVRDRVADRGVVRRAVDPDPRGGEAHPARAEGVARAGRDRLLALRPRRARRVPPGIPPLDDDLEAPERRWINALAGRDGEDAPGSHAVVEIELVRAAADHDHGSEAPLRQGSPHTLVGEAERAAPESAEGGGD